VQLAGRAFLLPEALLDYRLHGTNTIRENRAAMVFEICWVMAVHVPPHVARPGFWTPGASDAPGNCCAPSTSTVRPGAVEHDAAPGVGPPGTEMALLDPSDPVRHLFLGEIADILAHGRRDRPVPFEARLRQALRAWPAACAGDRVSAPVPPRSQVLPAIR